VVAESLTNKIAGEVHQTVRPRWVTVTVTQRPRGGIEVQTVAHLEA